MRKTPSYRIHVYTSCSQNRGEANYVTDDGKDVFEKLQEKVDHFNATENVAGGKAILQWYEAPEKEDMADLETQPPSTKKQNREKGAKPLTMAICTPLMARAHNQVYTRLERFSSVIQPLRWTGSIHLCSWSPQLMHAQVPPWLWSWFLKKVSQPPYKL